MTREKDPFLDQWEIDLTTREKRALHGDKTDYSRLAKIEKDVSRVIRKTFTFGVIHIDDKDRRLKLEARMIATINKCTDCSPSSNWLGTYSTKRRIKESGLWLVQGLKGQTMSIDDLEELKSVIEHD